MESPSSSRSGEWERGAGKRAGGPQDPGPPTSRKRHPTLFGPGSGPALPLARRSTASATVFGAARGAAGVLLLVAEHLDTLLHALGGEASGDAVDDLPCVPGCARALSSARLRLCTRWKALAKPKPSVAKALTKPTLSSGNALTKPYPSFKRPWTSLLWKKRWILRIA